MTFEEKKIACEDAGVRFQEYRSNDGRMRSKYNRPQVGGPARHEEHGFPSMEECVECCYFFMKREGLIS